MESSKEDPAQRQTPIFHINCNRECYCCACSTRCVPVIIYHNSGETTAFVFTAHLPNGFSFYCRDSRSRFESRIHHLVFFLHCGEGSSHQWPQWPREPISHNDKSKERCCACGFDACVAALYKGERFQSMDRCRAYASGAL